MDAHEALREAITSVPVPGAPPRFSRGAAAVGLSFLDTALRLNHVRRLTERLTVVEHKAARALTEVDISLLLLDDTQRTAARRFQEMRRSTEQEGEFSAASASTTWVPVTRISRQSVAPIEVVNDSGDRVPRLTQFESSQLLTSGMYRLMRGILASHPDATRDTPLNHVLYKADESRWLIQSALITLLAEQHTPNNEYDPPAEPYSDLVVTPGRAARFRTLALDVLERYGETLEDWYRLFNISLNDYLLVVGLDSTHDEHLLSYDSPVSRDDLEISAPAATRLFRSNSSGYLVKYRGQISTNIRAYHLLVESEPGITVKPMFLSTNADERNLDEVVTGLRELADRLDKHPRPSGRATSQDKILELEAQRLLRQFAALVRRRRWDADRAGGVDRLGGVDACLRLERIATAGNAVTTSDGEARSSLLFFLKPNDLRDAAKEAQERELHLDFSLENDPKSDRAHAYWRRTSLSTRNNSAQVTVNASFFLRDSTTAEGPRGVCAYAFAVALMAYATAVFTTGSYWPYSGSASAKLGQIPDSGALITVLLLVPGFLYSRLSLPNRHSVAGQLRSLSRFVARTCIAATAAVSAAIATKAPTDYIKVGFILMTALPIIGLVLLLIPSRRSGIPKQLVQLGAPYWLFDGDVSRVTADVTFSSGGGGSK